MNAPLGKSSLLNVTCSFDVDPGNLDFTYFRLCGINKQGTKANRTCGLDNKTEHNNVRPL